MYKSWVVIKNFLRNNNWNKHELTVEDEKANFVQSNRYTIGDFFFHLRKNFLFY